MTSDTTEGQEPEEFKKLVTINGRDIWIKGMTDGQFFQMAHIGKTLQSDKLATEDKITSVSRLFRIVRSVIVDDNDKEFIEDEISDGKLTMTAVVKILYDVFTRDSDEAPKPKARRGRPSQRQ